MENLKKYLFDKIEDAFFVHGYEVNKEVMKKLVERSELIIEKNNMKFYKVELFFEKFELGELGMLNRSPMSFLVMFSEFSKKNGKPKLAM
jgi:hypothetical protein